MKINEIIDEGIASWVGDKIGRAAGIVAGTGRAVASAYNQGAEAASKAYDTAATYLGGSKNRAAPKVAGTQTRWKRYSEEWETFLQNYREGGKFTSDAEFKQVLDKFIFNKYGVDVNNYPRIPLKSNFNKDATDYIFSHVSRAQADDLLNRHGDPAAPAASPAASPAAAPTAAPAAPARSAKPSGPTIGNTPINPMQVKSMQNKIAADKRAATTPAPEKKTFAQDKRTPAQIAKMRRAGFSEDYTT